MQALFWKCRCNDTNLLLECLREKRSLKLKKALLTRRKSVCNYIGSQLIVNSILVPLM